VTTHTPPAPLTDANGKRRRILNAAQELFAELGFEAASMEAIARRARVSKGTLYNYFASKEDLLVEAVAESMEGSRQRVLALVSPEGPERPAQRLDATLRALLVGLMPVLAGNAQSLRNQVWGLVGRDSQLRQRVFEHYREFYRRREHEFERALGEGSGQGELRADLDPADVALLLLAVFDGLVFRAAFDPERVAPARAFDVLSSLLDGGLRRVSAGGRRDGP
jgi:AcrR family transcriptional regulator